MTAAIPTLFRPGGNCYRAAHAQRAALLVNGEAYFRAFAHAALRATRSIIVVAWDFHSHTRLHLNEAGIPDLLGDFLNFLLRRNRRLRIFVLAWDYPLVFGRGREPPAGSDGGWQPHRRISFHYDSTRALGAAHHQKIVVIDGAVAFCGGIDLTLGRWDTTLHSSADPRRTNVGETVPYSPVHDVMLAVDSGAARALQSVASERWRQATGRALPTAYAAGDPWPASVFPMFSDVDVALARTVPAGRKEPAVTEVEVLYLDLIAAARRYIYIENQYFTSKVLGDALAARLAEPEGPEVVVVLKLASTGWLEAPSMSALRTVLLRKLQDADAHGRFHAWYPRTPGEPGCDVHSKLMIVDDEWLRVGSANFANRSMGLDTECDLVLEARGDSATRTAIASVRNALLSEHLGAARTDVQNAYAVTGSLGETIASLSTQDGPSLQRFERLDEPSPALVVLANGVVDPERPLSMEELIAGFDPAAAAGAPAARRERSSRIAGQINNFLGRIVLGILLGTLVATLFARQFAVGLRAALDVIWLLVATFAAIAASRWVMRRRVAVSRVRERARRQ
jgi:phospholipase D1/2